jgi:hypothetical protein
LEEDAQLPALAGQRAWRFAAAVKRGEKTFTALAASKKKLRDELREVAGKAGFKDCAKVGRS